MSGKKITITKYNPLFRDLNGFYTKCEWTSISDIGKVYENRVFTMEEYLETESHYLNAIQVILNFFQSKGLVIAHLFGLEDKEYFSKYGNSDLQLTLERVKTGDCIVEPQIISNVIKLGLREHIAELELKTIGDKEAFISFGFDYYMYLDTELEIDELRKQIESLGLYCHG